MYELFLENFAGWKNDILEWKEINEHAIEVTMKNGRVYEFGCKATGEMYLLTLKPSAE